MAGNTTATMYILDKNSNTKFLVDSGAEVSLFPAAPADRASGAGGPPLVAANGSAIRSYGRRLVNICLRDEQFEWKFIVADVPTGILGADFLRAHSLLVDLSGQCLVKPDLSVIRGFRALPSCPRISLVTDSACPFRQMLLDRPALTTPVFDAAAPRHGVQLHIPTTGPPVYARARRLAPEKLAVAKREFQVMKDLGIIRRSKSPWASPMHMVDKSDGGYRPCGDYRSLNNVTEPDKYPIPYLSDATHFLAGKTVFSKVDLVRGYHQIPVAPEDVPKTAVITPFGLFEFLRTPFGLKNAAQAFQRLMDQVIGDLPFLFVYLDDVLIASRNSEEHLQHVQLLFTRLEQHGLVVNPDKCVFAVPRLEFLGHSISSAGSAPLPSKVEAVAQFPRPRTVLEMMQFTGMINFYNRFLPRINLLMAPLFAATAGKKRPHAIAWTPATEAAFGAAKSALSKAALLAHPLPDAPTALTTDASDLGVGAVLEQRVGQRWAPLAFFSRKFTPAQAKYSAFDKELLAVHLAIRHFRYFLEGRPFVVYTDHKPLISALSKKSDPVSDRQARHLAAVAEFTTDIRHVQGKNNPVADALSRSPAADSASPVAPPLPSLGSSISAVAASATNLPALAAAQVADNDLQHFVAGYTGDKLRLGNVSLPDSPAVVTCELSKPAPRPLVPEALRRSITNELHGLSHPGVKASCKLVQDRFFWPNMAKDIRQWVAVCVPCQRSKVVRHTRPATQFIPVPQSRFEHIHVDVVGPLPPSQGYTHLFTIVDRYTRWPEAIPVADTTTSTLCSALLHGWVAKFGVPRVMTSDRGAQFTSALWANMSETLGVQLNTTTAYHPESNGMVERMHRQLKESLKARLAGPDWHAQLPWTLLGMRATWKQDLGASPAELVYGAPLTVPGDCLPTVPAPPFPDLLRQLHRKVDSFQPVPTAHHTAKGAAPPRPLPPDTEFVFVRRDGHKPPLTPAYDGPYRVLRQSGNVVTIQKGNSYDKVAASRCKAAAVDPQVEPQSPPRRGRPPAAVNRRPPPRRPAAPRFPTSAVRPTAARAPTPAPPPPPAPVAGRLRREPRRPRRLDDFVLGE